MEWELNTLSKGGKIKRTCNHFHLSIFSFLRDVFLEVFLDRLAVECQQQGRDEEQVGEQGLAHAYGYHKVAHFG